MQYLLEPYRDYLLGICRFHKDTVADCMDHLPRIFKSLQVSRVEEIGAEQVRQALLQSRWEITPEGIRRAEQHGDSYLLALKQFLQYLQDSGHPVPGGLANMVSLSEAPVAKFGGLTEAEQNQLRRFLVFNVKNDAQRRDTALVFLLMSVDCNLEEALQLKVHRNGVIRTDLPTIVSGDFRKTKNGMQLKLKNGSGAYRQIAVPHETLNFLNFYLENRKHKSNRLFIKNSGKNGLDAISPASAKRFVNKVFKKAGLDIKPAQIFAILQSTALETQVALAPGVPVPEGYATAS